MTILELYTFLQPLTQFLGTICLVALIAACGILTLIWLFRIIWRFVVATGAIAFFALFLNLVLEVM